MEAKPHRTLVVANRTAAAPLLLEEIARRRAERATVFVLLIPVGMSGKRQDWTTEDAVPLLERAALGPVQSIAAEGDPFEAVRHALDEGDFDDVIISTLPKRVSEWLRRDLPSRVQRLGVPVTVVSQHELTGDSAEKLEQHHTPRGDVVDLMLNLGGVKRESRFRSDKK